jgi:hypothetical protein
MGILKQTAERLEKFDEAVVATKESFNAQTALNVSLAIGVTVAILVAVIALAKAASR